MAATAGRGDGGGWGSEGSGKCINVLRLQFVLLHRHKQRNGLPSPSLPFSVPLCPLPLSQLYITPVAVGVSWFKVSIAGACAVVGNGGDTQCDRCAWSDVVVVAVVAASGKWQVAMLSCNSPVASCQLHSAIPILFAWDL